MTRWELLRFIVIHLDDMQRLFDETPRPFLYRVTYGGGFKISGVVLRESQQASS
jgi:hypothetical protein